MRATNVTALSVGLVAFAWAVVSCQAPAFAQAGSAADDSPLILLTATIDLLQPPFFGAVERITAEGELLVGPDEGRPGQEVPATGSLVQGLYLGVVRGWLKTWGDAHLVRVEVTEALSDGKAVATVGHGLDATIPVGKLVLLVRPPQTTTADRRTLADLVTLEQGPAARLAAEKPTAAADGAGDASTTVVFDLTAKPPHRGRGVRFNDIADGAFNTLMVGTLTRDARIPWTKPEDVVVGWASLRVCAVPSCQPQSVPVEGGRP